MKQIAGGLFGIDVRSLAVFRIAVALILLVDLAIRASDLSAMYTDAGMFPRAEISRFFPSIWNWSFHFSSGEAGFQIVLFGLSALLAGALLTGFETRIATIGSWLMLVSIHHRLPPVLSGAEVLLRMLLFWAMFVPLEKAWSLDGWLAKRRGKAAGSRTTEVVSAGTAALLLQMGLMYWFSALFKVNSQWLSGEALAGTLAHDFYGSPAGAWLLQFPALLKTLTRVTLGIEWLAPVLLFLSTRTPVRITMIGVLAALHAATGIFLEVGLFPWVAMAGLLLFLPTGFWNCRLFPKLPHSPVTSSENGPSFKDPAQRVCLVCLLYVVAVNLNTLQSRPLSIISPESWTPLARGLGLSQRWGMFEGIPSKDGWYIARATLANGAEVDLLRGGAPAVWERPRFPAGLYPNHYWQKLFREMAYDDEKGFQRFRAPVSAWMCREWNHLNSAEKQVNSFDLVYCIERKGDAGSTNPPEISKELLFHLEPGRHPPTVREFSPAG